jgi:hypothetical protein
MDVSATNFQAAWLDAVRRTQSYQPPIPDRVLKEDTLTDVLEAALRTAGLDSQEPAWSDPNAPRRRLDLTV